VIDPSTSQRMALMLGHPGHELRVFRWMELTRPLTFVLTDGSGSTGQSRLDSTTELLRRIGAPCGSIYGRLTDGDAYRAILGRDAGLFVGLAEELAAAFEREGIDGVGGDAIEGYNPVHDVCRLVLNAAVDLASGRTRRPLLNLEFLLVGRPDACPEPLRDQATWIHLDEAALERKLSAARGYPELAAEVDAAIKAHTTKAFQIECLRPVSDADRQYHFGEETPYYERYGEGRMDAGLYHEVIRYREHVLPLAAALRRHVEGTREAARGTPPRGSA